MDWYQLAKEREQELVQELVELLNIESVLGEQMAEAPFGLGPKKALDYMLQLGKEANMTVKNVENVAGHIEMGQGDEVLGILCHVDVVPAGDVSLWTYPPFEGTIVDGKLYARGAIDDKGPTMAAWLAMKLVRDAGVTLSKRVRMIIGTDEESGFRCVTKYFEKEEMPSIGFAPDADFPLINAEKGIAHLIFTQQGAKEKEEKLVSFKAGVRINMVPDEAVAIVQHVDEQIIAHFQQFLAENNAVGTLNLQGERYIITMNGKSAHAMEPDKGINAAILLATFLHELNIGGASAEFAQFIVDMFGQNCFGQSLQLAYTDEVSGPTTLNVGKVFFDAQHATIEVSMRYSVTYPFERMVTKAQRATANRNFTLDVADNSAPHYVAEEDELVRVLLSAYQKYTNDFSKPLSTGGGTYARVLKKGVAFGMLFPGEQELAHQANEFVVIDNLVKAAAIYAEAIVKLASS